MGGRLCCHCLGEPCSHTLAHQPHRALSRPSSATQPQAVPPAAARADGSHPAAGHVCVCLADGPRRRQAQRGARHAALPRSNSTRRWQQCRQMSIIMGCASCIFKAPPEHDESSSAHSAAPPLTHWQTASGGWSVVLCAQTHPLLGHSRSSGSRMRVVVAATLPTAQQAQVRGASLDAPPPIDRQATQQTLLFSCCCSGRGRLSSSARHHSADGGLFWPCHCSP